MRKGISILLILALTLCGCTASASTDLMADVPERIVCLAETPESSGAAADFSIRLFQSALEEGKNTLISPLSVLTALAMTAGGANGETLTQMEAVLGAPIADLDAWTYAFMDSCAEELRPANGIWFTDDPRFHVVERFLERNADYYHADLYQAPMDSATLGDINSWVSDKTTGMIPRILDELSPDAVMYLVNALAFEAEWETPYYAHQVHEALFTAEDGSTQDVQLMHSEENRYLEDEYATGFLKYYEGGRYAFAALLPKEGITVAHYVSTLTGRQLQEMLSSPEDTVVYAAIPKFDTEYSAELSAVLTGMGMANAFDPNLADFSAIGTFDGGNIHISQVVHKTFLSVTEHGTKAGAATAVEMDCGRAMPDVVRTVTLDRPFVFMLIDCEENLPIFIGTLMDMN